MLLPTSRPVAQSSDTGLLDVFVALVFLAALPWIFSAGVSYFMLAWRSIP